MHIGAQLYSVASHCQTLEGLSESLAKVADIGYKYVQMSGTCLCESSWLDAELKKNGLVCVLTHTPTDLLLGNIGEVIRWHKEIGCRYAGLGMHEFFARDDSDYEEFLALYKPVAKALKEAGMMFMYHNHCEEFKRLSNGKLLLRQMIEDFEPDELGVTADTFWIQFGGCEPAEILKMLAGRIPCIHLKDYMVRGWMGRDIMNYFAPIGEGNIDFGKVFAAAESGGTQYMLVEQDMSYDEDPFDCLRRSYDFLHANGFD